jgi:2-haloacid dehalogenase
MLDFTRFEVLTFDCYGTLINWETGLLPVLRRILSNHAKKIDDVTLLKLYGDFEQLSEQPPFHPYREVLQSVVRRFGAELSFVPTDAELRSLPESLPTWQPWPDTVEALRALKGRFRLAIISNVDDDLFAATRPKLEVEFDEVITAQQAQAYKPSRQVFELALTRIDAPAERILHVGQSIYHDVIPAQALGIATVWVNRPSPRAGIGAVKPAQAVPDLEVSSLAELVGATAQRKVS